MTNQELSRLRVLPGLRSGGRPRPREGVPEMPRDLRHAQVPLVGRTSGAAARAWGIAALKSFQQ